MKAGLLALLFVAGCAMHQPPPAVQPPQPQRVWIPPGVPADAVICVAIVERHQWICPTVGELRQILGTLAKL